MVCALAGAAMLDVAQLGLVPDFTPPPLLGAAATVERVVERTPYLRSSRPTTSCSRPSRARPWLVLLG